MRSGLLAIAALLTAGALLCVAAVASTFPRENGAVRVEGISGPVTIATDALGVVTIRAASIPDACFGLGYAHARDRLWQMEFQRRIGAGRLSEILGGRMIETDRFLRTIGFRRAAAQALGGLASPVRAQLEAYAAGVNQYLATSSARPIEFRLLRVRPEPFDVVDCLTWGKMMAWDLASSNATNEIRRARFVAAVGPERAAELFPPVPAEPTILRDEEWRENFGPDPRTPGLKGSAGASSESRVPSPVFWSKLEMRFALPGRLGFGGETLGSNSFVLAGSRTRSGHPLLGNDPHLSLRAPSLWYLARLEAPGLSVAGATLPGIPSVIIGHNARVAWGLTNLEANVQDLCLEETDPKDRGRYFHAGRWHRFDVRSETVRVRGAPDVALEIRSSVHGPIVTDVLRGAATLSSPAVALRWTGLDPDDTTSEAFAGFNTAANWREFLAAASRLKSPPQNIVYADVDGHIGYTASGSVPIRPRADGLLPVSGRGDEDWAGYVPFDRLPRVLDPPRGFVVTANNRVVSDSYPYALTRDWPEPYRARRITDRILSRALWSPEDARAIQLDQLSLQAEELLPLLLDTKPADTASARALRLLKGWDREFGPDSVPASIYASWYAKLSEMAQDELRDTPAGNVRSRFVINALKQDSRWCDDVRTPRRETCADFKAATLSEAVAALAARLGTEPPAWRWRRLHRARFAHGVFESVPVLREFFSLEDGVGGDASTVNVGAYRRDGSFLMTDGASYRQILDLADLSRGSYVHTTGQSGNVFDRHYRDLIAPWRDGRYITLDNPPVKTLVLKPSPAPSGGTR
jgi:penicillin amidase